MTLVEIAGSCPNDTRSFAIAQPHQSLPRNIGRLISGACSGRILTRIPSRLRGRDERSAGGDRCGVGVDPHQAGAAGSHGRDILRPGSGDRLEGIVPRGAWRRWARQAPISFDVGLRAPWSSGWSKAVSDINPDRVARLWSSQHADYRLRDRSLAMPLIGGNDYPHTRTAGGFRSPA